MSRRRFLMLFSGTLSLIPFLRLNTLRSALAAEALVSETITPITKADAEWKAQLPAASYDVLRHEGTEAPFTSPLLNEHRAGTFVCMGCALPLFPSKFKFDSGTGWPSFFDVITGHIQTKTDTKLFMERTEYHCARCGGHQGHVFNDGPQPTGLRHCNNGVALKFVPEQV